MMHQIHPAPQAYLSKSDIIDFHCPAVRAKAASLATQCASELELIEKTTNLRAMTLPTPSTGGHGHYLPCLGRAASGRGLVLRQGPSFDGPAAGPNTDNAGSGAAPAAAGACLVNGKRPLYQRACQSFNKQTACRIYC